MREIKFKCWDKREKKMYWNVQNTYDMQECHAIAHIDYPGLNKDGTICHDSCNGHDFFPASFGEVLRDKNYIVMQYTGLNDKNGKEIYEGDIVRDIYTKLNEVVEYSNGSYGPFWDGTDGYIPPDIFEVVGNIYENKELLK